MFRAERSLNALLLFLIFQVSTEIEIITTNFYLKDGDILVSRNQLFALGFFSPVDSRNRYVGVWYGQVAEQTVVWVANRNLPINDSSGVLTISSDGNLVIYERNQTFPLWSTNVSVPGTSNLMAQLLDSGNLVLVQNGNTSEPLWQSFDYPTNTMLPLMKLGLDYRTGLNWSLTSWRSYNDPATGNYSYRIDPSGFPQLYLYRGSDILWRSGSWTGTRWVGIPEMTSPYIFSISYVNNQDETFIIDTMFNASMISRMTLNESGLVQRSTWSDQNHQWILYWWAPKEQCDYYGRCGPNSNCNLYNPNQFECTCLPGFEPKSSQEWLLRDGSSGCVRNSGVSMCHSGEGFVKVARVKIPDTAVARVDMSLDLKDCGERCLENCSCVAYASAYSDVGKGGSGCLMWYGNLMDTRTYSNTGQDLYVRVDAAELARNAKNGSLGKKALAAVVVPSAVAMILVAALAYCLVKKRKGHRRRTKHWLRSLTIYFEDSPLNERKRSLDLTLFDLSTIATATDNFSPDNKLGEGGFGPVYKGVLSNGSEIAIKRLSKYSGQGIEEFKNEIGLIAKLQHRNLVRILGCCIDEEEKMLIYEYLTNKSLDSFIFDESNRSSLNWSARLEIICGIARGILYLHQDSRLRIIHRDLKASNILLDGEMNPKISDFGMARIFGGEQAVEKTNRVVGTYGYMSPEYAMEGRFSIKSDVYSFGVLLLEILTGRKNNRYYPDSPSSNLVGHVWDLWKEGKAMEIIDSTLLEESSPLKDVLRCIQISLLCVQEQAKDRPNMSAVVGMLSTDTALPSPKQPAFIIKRTDNHGDSTSASEGTISVNEVTVTMFHGR